MIILYRPLNNPFLISIRLHWIRKIIPKEIDSRFRHISFKDISLITNKLPGRHKATNLASEKIVVTIFHLIKAKGQHIHATVCQQVNEFFKNIMLSYKKMSKWSEEIPLYLPRDCNDFALSSMASNNRVTVCIDIGGLGSPWERLFGRSLILARVSFILGVTEITSIPSNTCKAASMFPFWYSYFPNKALASCKVHSSHQCCTKRNSIWYEKQNQKRKWKREKIIL